MGEVGRQWVQQCLVGGIVDKRLRLGRLLVPELDMEIGKVVVLGCHGELPHSDMDRLRASVSHLDVLDPHDSAAGVLELLKSLDAKVGGAAVIVEDDIRSPGDPYTEHLVATKRVIIVGEKVFHPREVSSLSGVKEVMEVLNQGASGYPLNAFVFRSETVRHFVQLVEHKDSKQLASGLLGTIHAVYDAEGYLAWVRTTPPETCATRLSR